MPLTLYQVDAFTDQPFAGNPAAVCVLSAAREERWMQAVAREMNLSETAYLHPDEDGFRLRWFTPVAEVDLCGHATLASAHILWQERHLAGDGEARFQTRSGLLTARRAAAWIEMDFPAEPEVAADAPPELADALGVTPLYVGRNRFDYLVEVESELVVREMAPDFTRLGRVTARGVMVTSASDHAGFDFVSRYFAPRFGINEDPVTGSAHCCLGPFWQRRLGKQEFVAFQASDRGGVVRVRVEGDRVALTGQAVTVLRMELLEA